jgi:hypothetical protein
MVLGHIKKRDALKKILLGLVLHLSSLRVVKTDVRRKCYVDIAFRDPFSRIIGILSFKFVSKFFTKKANKGGMLPAFPLFTISSLFFRGRKHPVYV